MATYVHNGRGERVSKLVTSGGFGTPATLYAYDEGGRLLSEYGGSGSVQVEYVYLDDVPIAVVKGTSLAYVETDHLGTPRLVFDPATNAAKWAWNFFGDAFGVDVPNESPSGGAAYMLNLRFPGQYYDAETRIYFNSARYYESESGRYTQPDPIGLVGGLDLYAYANSSPVNLSDPSGLSPGLPGKADCKDSEWKYCESYCQGRRVLGCYVTISWKIKGVRNGNPIKSEQRLVNCRCEEDFCDRNPKTCNSMRSVGVAILGAVVIVWGCLEAGNSALNVL